MTADTQLPKGNGDCQCELCKPNWYMGRDGDSFLPQPAEQPAQQVTLEELHVRKVRTRNEAAFAAAGFGDRPWS